jgi:hypothetical protein
LCLGADTAARALGKQTLREVLILKLRWVEEQNQEMRDELMAEMRDLMVGTQNLDVVVSSLKFIHLTAKAIFRFKRHSTFNINSENKIDRFKKRSRNALHQTVSKSALEYYLLGVS